MKQPHVNWHAAGIRVCVNRVEDGLIGGIAYSQRLTEPYEFNDFGTLILALEEVLDQQNFPASFQAKRAFVSSPKGCAPKEPGNADEYLSAEDVQRQRGLLRTFDVSIVSRQNTSWQGSVDWLNGEPPTAFASALELFRMVLRVVINP